MNIHVYPSTIENESRMLKIAHSLANNGIFIKIELLGKWRDGLPQRSKLSENIEIFRIKPLRIKIFGNTIGRFVASTSWYVKTIFYLLRQDISCINPHSLPVLPLAVIIKLIKKCRLVYDTHELETETIACRGIRRYLFKITEELFLPFADAICVVNSSIASWYSQNYNISLPFVVKNVPYRLKQTEGESSGDFLRETFDISENDIIFLYQGLLSIGRGIEVAIQSFIGKKNKHLVFMGYGELSGIIKANAEIHPNIHYLPAVAPEILHTITPSADVGLSLIENKCLSYYLSLPNKVFEYLNSGVPIIASNFPELNLFINTHQAGWITDPTSDSLSLLVDSLDKKSIKEQQMALIQNTKDYGWHIEEQVLLKMYQEIKSVKVQDF